MARCFGFLGPHLPLNVYFAITVTGGCNPLHTFFVKSAIAHWLFTLLEHDRPGAVLNRYVPNIRKGQEQIELSANDPMAPPAYGMLIADSASQRGQPSTSV